LGKLNFVLKNRAKSFKKWATQKNQTMKMKKSGKIGKIGPKIEKIGQIGKKAWNR
jgi:hypothetical protein